MRKNTLVIVFGLTYLANFSNLALARVELGDLLVIDSAYPAIVNVDPITGEQSVLSSGGLLQNPTDIVLQKGQALIADSDAGGLVFVNLFTGTQSLLSLQNPLCWLEIDASGDIAFGSGREGITRIDLVTGATSTITPISDGLTNPLDIVLGPEGNLLVADPDSHRIVSVNPATGESEPAVTGIDLCWLEVASDGETLGLGPDGLVSLDTTNNLATTLIEPSMFSAPTAVESIDGALVLADTDIDGEAVLYSYTRATRELVPLTRGGNFSHPTGIAVVTSTNIPEPTTGVLGLIALMTHIPGWRNRRAVP